MNSNSIDIFSLLSNSSTNLQTNLQTNSNSFQNSNNSSTGAHPNLNHLMMRANSSLNDFSSLNSSSQKVIDTFSNETTSLKILLIFACPVGSSPLRLQNEERIIRESVKNKSCEIKIEVLPACTVDDLSSHLLENRNCYDVIHFSGHADRTNLLVKDIFSQIVRQNGQVEESCSRNLLRNLELAAEKVIGHMEIEHQINSRESTNPEQQHPFSAHFVHTSNNTNTNYGYGNSHDKYSYHNSHHEKYNMKYNENDENTNLNSFNSSHHDHSKQRRKSKKYKFEIQDHSVKLKSGESVSLGLEHYFSRNDLLNMGVGSLVFESPKGAIFVPPRTFAELLTLHQSDSLRCVILNACGSRIQADHLKDIIPVTVCFESKISDDESVNFSRGFYCALAEGLSFENAFRQGQNRMELSSLVPGSAPRLIPGSSLVSMLLNRDLLIERNNNIIQRQNQHKPSSNNSLTTEDMLKIQSENIKLSTDNENMKSMIGFGVELLKQKDNEINLLKSQLASLSPSDSNKSHLGNGNNMVTDFLTYQQIMSTHRLLYQSTIQNSGSPKKTSKKIPINRPKAIKRSTSASSVLSESNKNNGRSKKHQIKKIVAFGLTTSSDSVPSNISNSISNNAPNSNSLFESETKRPSASRRPSNVSGQMSRRSSGTNSLVGLFEDRSLSRTPSDGNVLSKLQTTSGFSRQSSENNSKCEKEHTESNKDIFPKLGHVLAMKNSIIGRQLQAQQQTQQHGNNHSHVPFPRRKSKDSTSSLSTHATQVTHSTQTTQQTTTQQFFKVTTVMTTSQTQDDLVISYTSPAKKSDRKISESLNESSGSDSNSLSGTRRRKAKSLVSTSMVEREDQLTWCDALAGIVSSTQSPPVPSPKKSKSPIQLSSSVSNVNSPLRRNMTFSQEESRVVELSDEEIFNIQGMVLNDDTELDDHTSDVSDGQKDDKKPPLPPSLIYPPYSPPRPQFTKHDRNSPARSPSSPKINNHTNNNLSSNNNSINIEDGVTTRHKGVDFWKGKLGDSESFKKPALPKNITTRTLRKDISKTKTFDLHEIQFSLDDDVNSIKMKNNESMDGFKSDSTINLCENSSPVKCIYSDSNSNLNLNSNCGRKGISKSKLVAQKGLIQERNAKRNINVNSPPLQSEHMSVAEYDEKRNLLKTRLHFKPNGDDEVSHCNSNSKSTGLKEFIKGRRELVSKERKSPFFSSSVPRFEANQSNSNTKTSEL